MSFIDDFAKSVQTPKRDVHFGFYSPKRKNPIKRLNIYRNNYYCNLVDVLAENFPVCHQLVGDEFFRAVARTYVEKRSPTSPILWFYGSDFAEFLDGFPPVLQVPYLPDVARLEWAHIQCYHAKDTPAGDLSGLAHLQEHEAQKLCFAFHPSTQIVTSEYPIFSIWSFHEEKARTPNKRLSTSQGREDVLLCRPAHKVSLYKLPKGGYAFINALMVGSTMEQALEQASGSSSEFNPEPLLHMLVAERIINSFYI